VLSHDLWQRRYGGDPGVLGRVILLNGVPYEVIGVMPKSFRDLSPVDVWTPLAPVARTIGQGTNYSVIGRLPRSTSRQQAQAEMDRLTATYRNQYPGSWPREAPLGVMPYREAIAGSTGPALFILLGAISFVLLIACANVASVLLARATARRREMAVRASLGASPRRLWRQMLTESLLLALSGALAGLLIAGWSVDLLLGLGPAVLPRSDEIRVDVWAFGYAMLLAVLAAVLAGVAPAIRLSRTDLVSALKEGTRSGGLSATFEGGRVHGLLVTAEVALSLVLLAGAGLLMQSFVNLLRVDPGFDPERLLTARLWFTGTRYQSGAEIAALSDRLVEQLARLPGVEAAAVVAAGLPLERGGNIFVVPEGLDPNTAGFSADIRSVTPNFFRALGIPLQQGRLLGAGDREGAPAVAVVNARFVRLHFPEGSPLGRRIHLAGTPREIVGVVGDVRSFLDESPEPTVFIPVAQTPYATLRIFEGWFPSNVVIRAAVPPATLAPAVEGALKEVARQVPVGRPRTMEEVLTAGVATRRFNLILIGAFAGLAVVLTAVGLYGVLSYHVARRTHEIGIRMALGAQPGGVMRLVLGRGLQLASIGSAIGLCGAVATTRLIKSWLFGVSPTDLATLAAISVLLLGVALVACWIPARRATRVDPMVALRYE
jgi:predicted permease